MLTIQKADHNGKVLVTYSGWLLDDRDEVVVLARWQRPPAQLPYVTFAEGDFLVELFYRNRYYNIFALYDGSDAPVTPNLASSAELFQRPLHPDERSASAPDHTFSFPPCPFPLKGYYVNFTYPASYDAKTQVLIWRDLVLDLWIPVEGQPLLLDTDEYEALALKQRNPALDQAIHDALTELWGHAVNRTGPFASPSAANSTSIV